MVTNNFIIFFNEKEGTSPLVRLLNNFEDISVVHQVNELGWEPFDVHNCGVMPLDSLEKCFDEIYGNKLINMSRLNSIYTKTATRPLDTIDSLKIIAFKMRFQPAIRRNKLIRNFPIVRRVLGSHISYKQQKEFEKLMFKMLKKYQITTFIAVRQDVFRWALSKYHGDGKGNLGNLQFKIADGSIKKSEINKIRVSCDRLEKIIANCESILQRKKDLLNELSLNNIKAFPLLYENFCQDKVGYFEELFNKVNLTITREEISNTLQKGAYFEKVHSNNISSFVENHEEVMSRFGKRFVDWG